jgi:hypothetical protein
LAFAARNALLEQKGSVTCAESQSTKQTQSSGLGFRFVDDVSDSANHAVEVASNRIPFERSDFTEGYIKSKLGAVLQLNSSLCDCKRYFIFVAVEKESLIDPQGSGSADHFDVGQFDSDNRGARNDDSVLRGITKFVICEDQIVISAVRLETAKQPRDFVGESLAATPYATFEVVRGFAEGKMDIVDGQVGKSSDGHCGEFEGSPKILDCVNCPLCKAAWERFAQFDLVVFVDSVRIRLNKREAWCSPEVNPSAPFKIGRFFLCLRVCPFSAC